MRVFALTWFPFPLVMVALTAGCSERPAAGSTLGLNQTLFAQTTPKIIDPNATSGPQGFASKYIIAIVISGLVFIALCGGCVYLAIRRCKNRAARKANMSALSFYCDTHVDPYSAGYPQPQKSPWTAEEKEFTNLSPVGSRPVSAVKELNLQTDMLPTPPQAHTSHQKNSPDDYHFVTPTSTTSARSNHPLLYSTKPYQPSDFAASPATQSISSFSPVAMAGNSPMIGSPLVNQASSDGNMWESQPLGGSGWAAKSKKGPGGVLGTPVESKSFQMVFPPPPQR